MKPPASFGWRILKDALPIMIGYLPVAIAFGAAAVKTGLTPAQAVGCSLLIFSGASQFLLLSMLSSAASLPLIILFCATLVVRHILYGSVLINHFHSRKWIQRLFSFGLTDEVFASLQVALNRSGKLDQRWFPWMAVAAYGSWVGGTLLGCLGGDLLKLHNPTLFEATGFALPALFIALFLYSLTRKNAWAMLVSALVAGLGACVGYPSVGIVAALVIGYFCLGKEEIVDKPSDLDHSSHAKPGDVQS